MPLAKLDDPGMRAQGKGRKKKKRKNRKSQSSEPDGDVGGDAKKSKPITTRPDDNNKAQTSEAAAKQANDDSVGSVTGQNNAPEEPVSDDSDDLKGMVEALIPEEQVHDEEAASADQNKQSGAVAAGQSSNNAVVEPSPLEIRSALSASKLPLEEVARAWQLAPFLLDNLKRDGFESFFPIQALSIPDVITSERHPHVRAQDVCISAPTGSGKTLSYVLPILNALANRLVRRLAALVILPSRDLAMQVYQVIQRYLKGSNLCAGLAVGQSDFQAEQVTIMVGEGQSNNNDFASRSALHRRLEIEPGNLDLAIAAHGGICDLPRSTRSSAGLSDSGAVDILVCTPGRLVNHMDNTPGFTLQHLKFLVVDEADRLLSERFQNWIDRVLADVIHGQKNHNSNTLDTATAGQPPRFEPRTWRRSDLHRTSDNSGGSNGASLLSVTDSVRRPVQLRKFLVSATMTRDPRQLESLRLVNPKFFNVHALLSSQAGRAFEKKEEDKFSLPLSLEEYVVDCTAEQKPLVLCSVIMEHLTKRKTNDVAASSTAKAAGIVVVFTASVESTHRLARLLQLIWQSGGCGDQRAVVEFSSALSQSDRTKLVQRCNQGAKGLDVLVCSDGMSRGMDIENLTMVVNYDIPNFAKTYVHRCGRTARAGKAGKAISILRKNQVGQYKKMRRLVQSPDRVQQLTVDKSLARTVVPVYRQCLASLREVLEEENNGELSTTALIPDEIALPQPEPTK